MQIKLKQEMIQQERKLKEKQAALDSLKDLKDKLRLKKKQNQQDLFAQFAEENKRKMQGLQEKLHENDVKFLLNKKEIAAKAEEKKKQQ